MPSTAGTVLDRASVAFREWYSRGYRPQAFDLAAMQCERLLVIAGSDLRPRRAG